MVSPEDIQRVAQRYFDPSDARLTCVGVLDDELLHDVRRFAKA